MHGFIKKLQESDNGTKRLWLFLFSGMAMFIVVFLWLNYFNSLVRPAAEPQQVAVEQSSGRELGVWQTFKAGTAIIISATAGVFYSLINIFHQPKDYIIQP